jgi:hypothetical protein
MNCPEFNSTISEEACARRVLTKSYFLSCKDCSVGQEMVKKHCRTVKTKNKRERFHGVIMKENAKRKEVIL